MTGANDAAAAHGARWIYFKLYPGLFGAGLDHLIANDLAPLAGRGDVAKWHFLRMIDDGGPHLRVRFLPADPHARESLAARIERELRTLADELPFTPESPFTPLVATRRTDGAAAAMVPAPRAPRAHVQRDAYEPETGKYGLGEMLEACETHFQVSSEIAAAAIAAELLEGRSRKGIAPLLMARCVHLFELPRPSRQFLADYCDYWLRGADPAEDHRGRFAERIADLRILPFDPLDADALLVAGEQDLLARWETSIRQVSRAAGRHFARNDNFRDQLAFNLCHLMMNRLGFPATDEAYLACLVAAFDRVPA